MKYGQCARMVSIMLQKNVKMRTANSAQLQDREVDQESHKFASQLLFLDVFL
jgi:hypothetical protein